MPKELICTMLKIYIVWFKKLLEGLGSWMVSLKRFSLAEVSILLICLGGLFEELKKFRLRLHN
jgi:hypothetical protein